MCTWCCVRSWQALESAVRNIPYFLSSLFLQAFSRLCSFSSAQGPAEIAVADVHLVLRQIVGQALDSTACVPLQRYTSLKRAIAGTAAAALSHMQGSLLWYKEQLQIATAAAAPHITQAARRHLPRSRRRPTCKVLISVYKSSNTHLSLRQSYKSLRQAVHRRHSSRVAIELLCIDV